MTPVSTDDVRGLVVSLTQGVLCAAHSDFCLLAPSIPREKNPHNERNTNKRDPWVHTVYGGEVKISSS